MSVSLRPYQVEALQAIRAAEARGLRRLLVQMATGLGKTLLFGTLVAQTPGRSLVLAHRDELIEQAVAKLRAVASDLEIGLSTLRNRIDRWDREMEQPPPDRQEDMAAELKRLRRENEILRQEREILKKATAFFAKEGSR